MRVLVFDTETTGLPSSKILNPDKNKKYIKRLLKIYKFIKKI